MPHVGPAGILLVLKLQRCLVGKQELVRFSHIHLAPRAGCHEGLRQLQ